MDIGKTFRRWSERLQGRIFDRIYVAGGRYCCINQSAHHNQHPTPDLRAVGFDWLLYEVMTNDQARVAKYRRDINALVGGRTVLEIGAGPVALLTRMAADAGASEVVSVEANDWVSQQARRRLTSYGERVRLITGHSDDLTPDQLAGRTHFDVLVLECYHGIASQERVVETIHSLRTAGFTFDTVISRGFTTYVAPAMAPDSSRLLPLERRLMGWPARRAKADPEMARQFSTMHGDMQRIARQRLAPKQRWQHADLQAGSPMQTEAELTFELDRAEDFAGLQFFNVFDFQTGSLDTGSISTHWGVYFVPLPVQSEQSGPATLTLHTRTPNPEMPSQVELQAHINTAQSDPIAL